MDKTTLDDLLLQRMNRKEFLLHCCLLLLTLTGIGNALQVVTQSKLIDIPQQAVGYGVSGYGA